MTEQNMQMIQKESRITSHSHVINTYYINLDDDIDVPSAYREELELINNCSEDDTIVLNICTGGGVLDTAMLFHRALRNTPAHTVALIGPSCASAGSVIALSCAEWFIDDTSSLMCHTSTYGIVAKDTDIYEHANFSRKQLVKLYNNVYKGFLTDEEISDVIKGTPFYFDCDDLAIRLNNLMEYKEQLRQSERESEECEPQLSLEEMISKSAGEAVKKEFSNFQKKFSVQQKAPKQKTVNIDPVAE